MAQHFNFMTKTGKLKPFDTVEDFDEFIDDCCKLPDVEAHVRAIAAMSKSKIKRGFYDGVKFDSQWEAAFYVWARDVKHYAVTRNKTEFLVYVDVHYKTAKFYPDFICNGIYYEIKGQWRDNDYKKQEQHPNVVFLSSVEMTEIIKEVDREVPNWRSMFIET